MSEPARARRPRWLAFDGRYLAAALFLFLVEVFIALRVHDAWVRPHGGDLLVVIFLYCSVKAFLALPVVPVVLAVLAFSYVVEVSQYFHFVQLIGLGDNKIAVIVLGSSFSWWDLVSYTLGAALVVLGERGLARRSSRRLG